VKLTRVIAVATSAAALAVVPLAGANAAPGGTGGGASNSPTAVCAFLADNDPGTYEFFATKPGGCPSTVASVGVEALMSGAFPSTAAAIGNCKGLEKTFPNGYPYSFYEGVFDNVAIVTAMLQEEGPGGEPGMSPEEAAAFAPVVVANYEANKARFTAKNRAGCVSVLKDLHSGELFGLLFAPPAAG
jgi:hypothetical protein